MESLIKIFFSILLGGLLGAERGRAGKAAGLRTYMLVTLAATVFTLISQESSKFFNSPVYDPGRLMSQVVLGIGFLGAGIIIYDKERIRGLTTAAGLWVATSIGMMVGIGQYLLATLVTLLSFLILAFFGKIEEKIENE